MAVILFVAPPVLPTLSAAPETSKLETVNDTGLYQAGRWEFSLESTYTFQIVSNPFHSVVAGRLIEPNPIRYHFATQLLTARYRLTNPVGPWFLRGSLESSVTIVGTTIVNGPEDYFAGVALGFRYDFVQPGARLVPFLELRGGPGVTDSQGGVNAQQQDLIFTYLLSAGIRYDFSRRWTVELGAIDQHLSNGYLAPKNYGVDSLGVVLGAFAHF